MSPHEDIIVTGASGFLGSAVLREIATQGRPAIGIVRRAHEPRPHHRLIVTDLIGSSDGLRRAITDSRAAILFHCALPERPSFDTDPHGADSLAEQIDLNVIRACVESECMHCVVLVSSAAVYGQLNNSEKAVAETRLPDPVTPYGRTKLAQEKRMTTALGARLAIARVFNVTGPAEPISMVAGSLAQRIVKAESQSVLPIHNSQSVRDFSDVRDVAAALLEISSLKPTAPRCFNISSGVGTTILELAGLILSASGREVKIKPDYLGAESRSVGDPELLRSTTGWRNSFRLEESARAVWNSHSSSPGKK